MLSRHEYHRDVSSFAVFVEELIRSTENEKYNILFYCNFRDLCSSTMSKCVLMTVSRQMSRSRHTYRNRSTKLHWRCRDFQIMLQLDKV